VFTTWFLDGMGVRMAYRAVAWRIFPTICYVDDEYSIMPPVRRIVIGVKGGQYIDSSGRRWDNALPIKRLK